MDHAEVLVDRVVSCHCRVSRFVHAEHVEDVVIFVELKESPGARVVFEVFAFEPPGVGASADTT